MSVHLPVITCTGMKGCPVPHGVWLDATARTGVTVPADCPYPHVCNAAVRAARQRDCPACQTYRSSHESAGIDHW